MVPGASAKAGVRVIIYLWSHKAMISAAHEDPFGKCQKIHGHTWFARVAVIQVGLKTDVRDLNRRLDEVAKKLDHTNIGDWSTEGIANYIATNLPDACKVEVEETGYCTVVLER